MPKLVSMKLQPMAEALRRWLERPKNHSYLIFESAIP